LLANFEIHGRVHVHGNGFDSLAALLSQQLEEWPDRFSAGVFGDPQHPHSLGIQGDSGIPVTLVQGEFVHDQAPYAFRREVTMQVLQALVIDDYGHITLNRDLYPGALAGSRAGNNYALKGAGLALSWRPLAGTTAQVTVARKVGSNPGLAANGRDVDGSSSRTRAWFQVMTSF